MNQKANYIKQRLSLRAPLKDSLDILATLSSALELKKETDLQEALKIIQQHFPTCTDFERDFPSICFSIATGVGKTRLMGACITYLYLQHGIRNFFVLAPNITIYEKLIEDFGNPSYHKYVFQGISEFVHNRPVIITGDNYNQAGNLFSDTEIRINIFNVAKFNSENKGTKQGGVALAPRIKRLSEYLGQSYWEYLSGLDDLVILMDEAHRYHADASKKAINELKPVLGIELTATPIDEKGKPFKNVVYEYSLAKALEDGKFVKNPAIATRKNFRTQGLSRDEIEKIKLEDAISIHQDTKNELEIYARNYQAKLVKPFVLVVCRDIDHASEVYQYINSTAFYGGTYQGKVLQIDSSTKKDEEVDKQFVALEQYDNDIEIVIHVNMLKEGWDVSNLYTIVPLRAANAAVLIEQTIGRGLRLPFNGERTGVEKIDKLTVIAHDNFEAVIAEAQNPDSILNKVSFVEIDDSPEKEKSEVISSPSTTEVGFAREEKRIATLTNHEEKQRAQLGLDAKRAVIAAIPSFGSSQAVKSFADLHKPEVKAAVIEKVKKNLYKDQTELFESNILAEAEATYEKIIKSYQENIIEIPRIDLVQEEIRVWFEGFDLDTATGFNYTPLGEEIMVVELTGERKTDSIGVKFGAYSKDNPLQQIVSELINYPDVDYDENADLLFKLAQQALKHLAERLEDASKLQLTIKQFRKHIAFNIYQQMRANFRISEPDYLEPKVFPFVKIEPWNFTALPGGRRHYKDVISPLSLIPKLVFTGFEKACHLEYKFDSKTEKDFAFILEQDSDVQKWLRPAPNQFRIYWANNSKQYYPDFVVETADAIYMVETKASDQLNTAEVLDKKKAALRYCKYASEFTVPNGGKPWKYLLIPHDEVKLSSSFGYFRGSFEKGGV
ncbi:DEAD/DEAH box helicase [Mongoliitalea lutea]|uniref:Type III restriction endonuclease subunit R n=1 Tax=Mongoliitalea lutea TaxID=849756 RepID=A0A8J3G754_9BACT|nr:DEAD/DEAH box helicase family protein [Mongoliitalea lutea]GHB52903.1 type III restriction endonuclease subunit R [Mongoliitalea lutea]